MNKVISPHPESAGVREGAVIRAIELMLAGLDQRLNLAVLARAGLFSPFHFHRVFREITGVTPARFLAALRMAEAKRLLLHSRTSVVDVSVCVGYESPGTFSTQFTQLVGVAPGRFRQLMRTVAGESVQSLVSAAPPRREHRDAPAARGESLIRLSGAASVESVVVGGVFAEGSVREQPDTWIVASGGNPVCAATVPTSGWYRAYAVVIDPRTCLVSAFVDQTPGTYQSGTAHIRLGAGVEEKEPIHVPLRASHLTDPPLLAVTPLRWLDAVTPCSPPSCRGAAGQWPAKPLARPRPVAPPQLSLAGRQAREAGRTVTMTLAA